MSVDLGAGPAEVAGFGRRNTRGSDLQDRWAVCSGVSGTWLAVADGIGGGPRGAEAAGTAINLAGVVLGVETGEADVLRVFDLAHAALWPWYVDQDAGGTTLTLATVSATGVLVASVGDSPAYLDLGAGLEAVTEVSSSHRLRAWLGSVVPPRPQVRWWPLADVRRVVLTSDGVDPAVVGACVALGARAICAALAASPGVGGDDASGVVAVLGDPTAELGADA